MTNGACGTRWPAAALPSPPPAAAPDAGFRHVAMSMSGCRHTFAVITAIGLSSPIGAPERLEPPPIHCRFRYRFETLSQPVDALRRAAEQHRLLVGRGSGGQAFESVPQDRIARGRPVRREVALEH